MVHRVAREGFSAAVGDYERSRPSYPADAVAWLVAQLQIRSAGRIADLAAGTGKLTRLLEPYADEILAIEPLSEMRRELVRHSPRVAVVAGSAEQLPLADGSLDAVTVAQAFHWFDADSALRELHRVVRPGGRVGLVWNARDRSVDWVDQVWAIMDRVEKKAPWRDHDNWRDSAFVDAPGFSELVAAEFFHEHHLRRDDVVARVASVSHVAILAESERETILDEVRSILDRDPQTQGRDEVAIPYRVDVMYLERLG